jgi:hypothetical protein
VAKDIDIFCLNEPTKSSLIGEKLPNLVTLVTTQAKEKIFGILRI